MNSITGVYNIFEFASLDDVFVPVRNTARVKYTCYDVSKKFLFIGANSGSLYVFLRNPLQYLRVLSNKEGPLICIRIASHDQYVAFATSKGVVVLLEHNVSNVARVGRSGTPTRPPRGLHVSREHQGTIITALTWNDSGTILFIADDRGKITSVTVNTPSKKTKTLFKESTAMIAKVDSKIVQMDFAHNKLLISTLTSCYLCDTQKEQYSQIGSKPRAGEFGACFYAISGNQRPCIYAARPGSRLWEVDFDGSVLCTHQFKQALAQKPVPFVSVREHFISGKTDSSPVSNSLNFPKLLIVGNHFLLTWVKNKLLLINPASMTILLWTSFAKDVEDIKVHAKKLYVWLSALLCDFYKPTIISASSRKLLPKNVLETLVTHLSQSDEKELKKAMEDLVASLETEPEMFGNAKSKGDQISYQIESGIYIVNRPRGDPRQLTPHPECSSSGSSVASRKTGNGVLQPNGSTTLEKWTGSANGKADKVQQETKLQHELFSRRPENVTNMVQSTSKAIKKSSSGSDMQRCMGGKQGIPRVNSLENCYYEDRTLPMPMPYIGGAFWDVDPTYGYSSLAALNPGAALDGLRNSLTSKYKSGKESILGKIGILEDHLKSITIDNPPEPLDVPTGNSNTSSSQDIYSELQNSYEEDTKANTVPILKLDLTELLNATKETLAATLNPAAISSISEQRQILERWVNVLVSSQELMYRTIYGQISKAGVTDTTSSCTSIPKQSKPDINVPIDHVLQYPCEIQCNNQPYGPNNNLRRKSWPNTGGDKEISHTFRESKDNEHLKQVFKSCPSALGSIAICGQCSDQLQGQASPLLRLEDFQWRYDMILLDENFIMQIKDAKEGLCLFCHPTIFTKDPWGLRSDEHKLVSRLAAACFKTRTFGRIWKYSADFACFKNIANLDPGDVAGIHDTLRCTPTNIARENGDNVYDHARAIFVTNFFHFLDTKEIFRELHHDRQSTFQTWSVVLSGVMKNAANRCSEFKSFNPLLSALSCRPQDFQLIIGKLLSEQDSFTARDILYVEQLRQSHTPNLFTEYMNTIYECRSPRAEILTGCGLAFHTTYQEACKDPVVQVAWLQFLLQDGLQSSPGLTNCACGKPKPWAHLLRWKRTDLILQILRLIPENQGSCQQLCEQYGFWLGYLYLCHGIGKRQRGLEILVQLGDITLFNDHFNIAMLPQTTDEWKAVLHLIAQKETKKNYCLFCETILPENSLNDVPKENILTLVSIAPFLLKHCGNDTTLQLLKEIMEKFPDIKLSTNFYWQCILSAIVKRQERNMDVGSHKNYASPQIRSHLKREMEDGHLENSEAPAINRCPFREDFPCHWGINIDLSSLCHTCSLPLALPLASAHEGGIRMFPCGHGFHLQCITSSTCPVCST